MTRTSFAQVDDPEIIRLYCEEKWTVPEIAAKLYWSKTTITKRLRENGVVIRGNKLGNPRLGRATFDQTRKLHAEGKTTKEIASIQGVSISTMLERLERLGLQSNAQTRCRRGHEFTPENTRINTAGARVCRACARRLTRESKARKQAPILT